MISTRCQTFSAYCESLLISSVLYFPRRLLQNEDNETPLSTSSRYRYTVNSLCAVSSFLLCLRSGSSSFHHISRMRNLKNYEFTAQKIYGDKWNEIFNFYCTFGTDIKRGIRILNMEYVCIIETYHLACVTISVCTLHTWICVNRLCT